MAASELSVEVFEPSAAKSAQSARLSVGPGRAEPPGARVPGLPAAQARRVARPGAMPVPRTPAVPAVEHPSAESGCRHPRSAPAAAPEQLRLVQPRAALPIAESDCRRWADSVAALPDGTAEEAAVLTALPRAVRALKPGPVPGTVPAKPDLPNSARWSCPRMSDRATAVSGPHRPARPTASGPLRWLEVCESYRSPEQQCCH